MKNLFILAIGAACFIPAGIIGWVNRPQKEQITNPTNQFPHEVFFEAGSTFVWEEPLSKQELIELKPIKIYSDAPHKVVPVKKESKKEFVCRDYELYNGGGSVKHCDWL